MVSTCLEMVSRSQQPPDVGCWAPFSCSWGTEGSPSRPRPGARNTPQPGRLPSSGTLGALLFSSWRLAGAHNQSGPQSRGKSYCHRKVAVRYQWRRRTATVRLLCDAFFLNGPQPTFKKSKACVTNPAAAKCLVKNASQIQLSPADF
jgi:hypothetical protein